MRVAGRTLVVIGAGSDIGRAVALEAVRRGARVAAADRDPVALGETARQVVAPQQLSTHPVDATDRLDIEALPAAVIERWGRVDGVIDHAGTLYRAFLPLLRTRPEAHLVHPAAAGTAQTGAGIRVTVVLPGGPERSADEAYRAACDLLDAMERNAGRVRLGADRWWERLSRSSRRTA
ncbi:NAD(P)-dependent dehydrogenase (short-subunit alcohol dehydrogenase family) [Actinoplanes octamycinicus]|uniref:NAD(P)-dependent dehydrogenase (Short-subunit alcohol dehydrogenase family) n=1 Tax=Actinoplanes octamycinicus TaxID=135948 RepID=A0A7W7GXR5_9ACTN|nr:SDR family NAD(P)-dependent oxidoreductase [Actinoplanes octamycinicus]MBB4740202.1 NAD(P)-dependent dehydrogenase (short-subunit alcohol dehydrogenase family) [Actinoplanes octamycinicus]GIE59598.1 short-chain dehydrogenase [Actinoplanes octamycinicus]